MDMTPGVVWTLGLPLLIAAGAADPYWQSVAQAPVSGDASNVTPDGNFPELWKAAGAVGVLILLVAVSDLSHEGGTFAAVFLLALWILFLMAHADALGGFFARLSGAVPSSPNGHPILNPGRVNPPTSLM